MSTLDGVCAASDDLALLVQAYLVMRGRNPWEAARLRKRFAAAANAVLTAAAEARAKRAEALATSWSPWGPQRCAAPPAANDVAPTSIPPIIA